MVPYDWGVPNLGEAARRASGPFVNPDHFAGYLAMIFPLALAGLVFGGFPARASSGPAARLMFGLATFLIFTAVALSQSRAGWIGLGVGALLTITLTTARAREGSEGAREVSRVAPFAASIGVLSMLIVLAWLFVGEQGRSQTAGRVGDTLFKGALDLRARYALWQPTPNILREFPLFGVGLGAWPEIFFRFQAPPRTVHINNAAHNDYLELLIDVGVVGIALAGWLILQIGARLRKAMRTVPAHLAPATAAIISALVVMSMIEIVDFDLHIPANLILFTTLAALGLRIGAAQSASVDGAPIIRPRRSIYVAAAAAIALGIVAMTQSGAPYPYNIAEPATIADARNLMMSYPSNPGVHQALLRRFGTSMDASERAREIETWAWLDPTASEMATLATPDASFAGASSINSFNTIGFRSANIDSGDAVLIDSVRIQAPGTQVQAVPEPGSLTLLSFGLFGLGWACRGRLGRKARPASA
jgi:hypothetical protein